MELLEASVVSDRPVSLQCVADEIPDEPATTWFQRNAGSQNNYNPEMAQPSPARIAVLLALTAGAFGSGLAAQKKALPPVDPALPGRLSELKKFVKDRKMSQDFRAIGSMQNLSKDVAKWNPKDADKIVKTLGDLFRLGKVRTGNKDILYRETAEALTKFGVKAGKPLEKAATNNRFKDNLSLRAYLVKALGKTKDPKQVKYILELTSRSPHDGLRAASGEALGNFDDAKVKTQRDIVKEIIKAWGSLDSQATQAVSLDPNGPQDFGPQNARRTLRAAEGKWVATLQKLTGVTLTKFRDWQRWQNKNKNWKPPK